MRVIRSFISLSGFTLCSVLAISSICLAQSNQGESAPQINVPSLLAETGYKYVEVRKGLWKIPELPYQGRNLKNLIIFLEPNPASKSLRISFRLGFLTNPVETAEFPESHPGGLF